jgi:HlyD family secretion protein
VGKSLIKALVVIALVALAGWTIFNQFKPEPVEVAVHTVSRGWVEATVANTRAGTVKACRRAKLAPQMSGQVSKLPVNEGDRVKKGDLLLALWNDDLNSQLQLTRSEGEASAARAEESCLAADLAGRDADRAALLYKDKIVDEQALDRANGERDTTRAACRAAMALQEESKSRVAVARAALARSILIAPFDGVVAELNAELGEVVAPSPPGIPTPPAVDLIEEGCLYVVAPIDEIDGRSVRPGQPARISLDAFPDQQFDGTVRRVAPYVLDREKQARTLDVEVDINDAASIPALIPGYSADVEVLLDRREDVLRIPAEAVSGENRVLILTGGLLEERAIEVGTANWQFIEVTSGLAAGDQVVISLDRAGVTAGEHAVAESNPRP